MNEPITPRILRTDSHYYVGLDLGQRRDFTAIAVIHHAKHTHAAHSPIDLSPVRSEALIVRYLERIPLGTLYPDIVARVRELLNRPALDGPVHMVVDETGVGIPVLDHLRRARLKCRLEPFTIGEASRRDLLHNLQFLFERGQIRFAANLPMLSVVMEELRNLQDRSRPQRSLHMMSSTASHHDDMAFALALAAWPLRDRTPIGYQSHPLPGMPGGTRLSDMTQQELRSQLKELLQNL